MKYSNISIAVIATILQLAMCQHIVKKPSVNIDHSGHGSLGLALKRDSVNNETQVPDCSCAPREFKYDLELLLDAFPLEVSWSLVDDSNGEVVSSGSGYTVENQHITDNHCLSVGCYTFTINDSFGDGICCSYGDGYYVGSIYGHEEKFAGDSFGSQAVHSFCGEDICATSSMPSASPTISQTSNTTPRPTPRLTPAPTSAHTAAPTSTPTSAPTGNLTAVPTPQHTFSASTLIPSSYPTYSNSSTSFSPSPSISSPPSPCLVALLFNMRSLF